MITLRLVITTHNNEEWTPRLIESLKAQECDTPWTAWVIDDASKDSTGTLWDDYAEENPNITVTHHTKNQRKWRNLRYYIPRLPSRLSNREAGLCAVWGTMWEKDDVIFFIDGDDWLTDDALQNIADVYKDPNIQVAYGSYVDYPSMMKPTGTQNTPHPPEIHECNAYRMDAWRASHPKTMRFSIWSNINPSDFDSVSFGDDLVMMFAAMEQVQPDQIKVLDSVNYVYNDTAVHIPVVGQMEAVIRLSPRYVPINPKPCKVTVKLTGGLGNMMFQIAAVYAYARMYPWCEPVFIKDHFVPNQGNHVENYIDNIFSKLNWIEGGYETLKNPIVIPESVLFQETDWGSITNLAPLKFTGEHDYVFDGHFQNFRLWTASAEHTSNTRTFFRELFGFDDIDVLRHSMGIHVRKGDYVKFPDHHPILPREYYLMALPDGSYGNNRLRNTYVRLFTDSKDYALDLLSDHDFEDLEVYSPDSINEDWEQMRDLAACETKIIANSSFSWWAAYLSPTGTVKYPGTWFGPGVTAPYAFDVPGWQRQTWMANHSF